jgi:hypothetical protein
MLALSLHSCYFVFIDTASVKTQNCMRNCSWLLASALCMFCRSQVIVQFRNLSELDTSTYGNVNHVCLYHKSDRIDPHKCVIVPQVSIVRHM